VAAGEPDILYHNSIKRPARRGSRDHSVSLVKRCRASAILVFSTVRAIR
jgi:hypothetical protein